MPNPLSDALLARDIANVRAAIKADPKAASKPRFLCEAAGQAFQPALELLVKAGGDLNGSWRGYRPLHGLIQSDAHKPVDAPSAERLKCLDWMLTNGADPEQTGAWPPARAVIIAAFSGRPEYLDRLRRKNDPYAAAALGGVAIVKKALRQRPEFANERDTGGLTALQCAAGSRMPGARFDVARLLLDAGADVHAQTRS